MIQKTGDHGFYEALGEGVVLGVLCAGMYLLIFAGYGKRLAHRAAGWWRGDDLRSP